jgi:CitMHS family citrate-Mg2+:H+ or citrate-Ca2+:H+ symporter
LVSPTACFLIPLVASIHLVISMPKLDYAENQRFTLKRSVINCFILLGVSLLTRMFPLYVC